VQASPATFKVVPAGHEKQLLCAVEPGVDVVPDGHA